MDPIQIGEQQYTVEQLQEAIQKADSYKKLEPEFTKKSQALAEAEKQLESLKAWGDFDAYLQQNPTLAKTLNDAVDAYQKGDVSQSNINAVSRAVTKAEKSGDDELAKRLEALEAQLQEQKHEQEMTSTLDSLATRAKNDGLEGFALDAFQTFADKWLEEEMGIGDDDEVTPKDIKAAYHAYKAELLQTKRERGKVPPAGTGTGSVPSGKSNDEPKGFKERAKQARKWLSRS